jgi:hypothetical protein
MGEPTASLVSGYLAIQADLDRDSFFAFWNEDEYGVGYASGPFSGIVGDIEMGASPQPGGGGGEVCTTKRRTFDDFKDRGE